MATTFSGVDDLKARVGQHIGHSDWMEITQDRVDRFADATDDHQWIHVDPERARQGPFGGTIAHGYLTLSLLPMLLGQTVKVSGFSMGINYGLNKLRFPSPVPVGSKLRVGAKLATLEDVTGGMQLTYECTFEVEGNEKPAAVAEVLTRYYE